MNRNKLEESDKLIKYIIDGILEKKGHEIVQLDFKNLDFAPYDHFIICHGDSGIQIKALAESIEKKVKENLELKVGHREGTEVAQWILLDYGMVVVHIFQKETRDHFKLEALWGDAEMVIINEDELN